MQCCSQCRIQVSISSLRFSHSHTHTHTHTHTLWVYGSVSSLRFSHTHTFSECTAPVPAFGSVTHTYTLWVYSFCPSPGPWSHNYHYYYHYYYYYYYYYYYCLIVDLLMGWIIELGTTSLGGLFQPQGDGPSSQNDPRTTGGLKYEKQRLSLLLFCSWDRI